MPKKLAIFLILIGLFFSLENRAAFSDGDLVKGSGPEVYAIEHGAKRWIPNPDIFQKLFYDWKKILLVGDSVLSGIPPGNKLENGNNYPDGALIRAAKRKEIYVIDQGKRRWIPNPDIFYSNNFSPGKVIIVSDEKVNSIEKGVDVETGEFLRLPGTFITDKPDTEIDYTRVTFRYSGTNPTGPISELSWETFLDGYDSSWQRATADYSRVVDLPAANKLYTFYVRSRNRDGKIDPSPASVSFKISSFSFYWRQLRIGGVKNRGSFNLDEYVQITNSSRENVNITGLILKNGANETSAIPKGVNILYVGSGNYETNIILNPGSTATIFTNSAPIGESFRLNKCAGYLNVYNFLARLPNECPRLSAQDISSLSKDCRDYINGLGTCAIPDTGAPKIAFDKDCTDYLVNNLSYAGCLRRYQFDPDFTKNDWYVFLNKTKEIWDDQHDEVKLTDKDGNLIDSYGY